MIGSLIGLFWYGFAFKVFGSIITADWQHIGFFAWIALGMFGIGFASDGVLAGLKTAGKFVLLAAAAVVIGILLGHYR